MDVLRSAWQLVYNGGILATAIWVIAIMLFARGLSRVLEKRGYKSVSWGVQKFSLVMCGTMVLTYLYSAVSNIGIALGLWK